MQENKREELINLLNSVVEPNGAPYFSKDWIVENIMGIKDKAKERKIKIKRISLLFLISSRIYKCLNIKLYHL